MKTVAPAKINWTLEVLGRRDDGYHEIRSVMQTIDLCDELWAEAAEGSSFETTEGSALPDDDLIPRAARALEGRVERRLPARIRVEKRIPVASGLGGGSSDAAAVLRMLNGIYELGLSSTELASVGATLGSDVPFFVYGGTAMAGGRGERVTPLPDAEERWLALVVPRVKVASKTERMYKALTEADYTEGSITKRAMDDVRAGVRLHEDDLCNVFDSPVYEMIEGLKSLGDDLFIEGMVPLHVVGAGPSIFARFDRYVEAETLASSADALAADAGSVDPTGYLVIDTFVVRTLCRREATSIWDASVG